MSKTNREKQRRNALNKEKRADWEKSRDSSGKCKMEFPVETLGNRRKK